MGVSLLLFILFLEILAIQGLKVIFQNIDTVVTQNTSESLMIGLHSAIFKVQNLSLIVRMLLSNAADLHVIYFAICAQLDLQYLWQIVEWIAQTQLPNSPAIHHLLPEMCSPWRHPLSYQQRMKLLQLGLFHRVPKDLNVEEWRIILRPQLLPLHKNWCRDIPTGLEDKILQEFDLVHLISWECLKSSLFLQKIVGSQIETAPLDSLAVLATKVPLNTSNTASQRIKFLLERRICHPNPFSLSKSTHKIRFLALKLGCLQNSLENQPLMTAFLENFRGPASSLLAWIELILHLWNENIEPLFLAIKRGNFNLKSITVRETVAFFRNIQDLRGLAPARRTLEALNAPIDTFLLTLLVTEEFEDRNEEKILEDALNETSRLQLFKAHFLRVPSSLFHLGPLWAHYAQSRVHYYNSTRYTLEAMVRGLAHSELHFSTTNNLIRPRIWLSSRRRWMILLNILTYLRIRFHASNYRLHPSYCQFILFYFGDREEISFGYMEREVLFRNDLKYYRDLREQFSHLAGAKETPFRLGLQTQYNTLADVNQRWKLSQYLGNGDDMLCSFLAKP